MENKSYSCLKYFFLAESFKFGCYNSLDNSWPALWERVVKMGRGEDGNIKDRGVG